SPWSSSFCRHHTEISSHLTASLARTGHSKSPTSVSLHITEALLSSQRPKSGTRRSSGTASSSDSFSTPVYMAPEIYRRQRYTEKADVYSFGILLAELWSRKEPYAGEIAAAGGWKPVVDNGTAPFRLFVFAGRYSPIPVVQKGLRPKV